MTCKRGHSDWFLTKRINKRNRVCEFIMAYRQSEGLGDRALFCCDLRLSEDIPKGWQKV